MVEFVKGIGSQIDVISNREGRAASVLQGSVDASRACAIGY